MAEVPRTLGRYALYSELASGGMATVHLGRMRGQVGFARTVAIKRLHATFAKEPDFVSMLLDEARLAARVRHPNVVPVLDVEAQDGELFLVLEYVHGESLAKLMRLVAGQPLPCSVSARIAADMLNGLHAAHEAANERGEPLQIVHRDISPQNVLVGVDGVTRVTDFGIAKAANRVQTTHEGQLKGKLAYMAPEQLREQLVDRRTDVYSASVVLWEMLTARRLFASSDAGATVTRIISGDVKPPSTLAEHVPPEVDAIVMKGLANDIEKRFSTAEEMAVALEKAVRLQPPSEVGAWVRATATAALAVRAERVAEIETSDSALSSKDHGAVVAAELARRATESLSGAESKAADRLSSPTGGQLSNISVERSLRSSEVSSGRRRWAIGAGVGAFVVVLGVVLAFVVRSPSSAAGPAAAPAVPPSAVSAPSGVAAPSASLQAEPEPPPAPSAEPETSSSAEPVAKAPAPARSPRSRPGRAAAPVPKTTAPGPKSDFKSLTRE
jgi:eukaryotic-like serine/threonine-protein kinase